MGGTKKVSKRNQVPAPNFGLDHLLEQLEGIMPEPKVEKTFVLDYDKIKTVEDVVEVLKGLAPEFQWYTNQMPDQFKALHEKGFLLEKESIKFNVIEEDEV